MKSKTYFFKKIASKVFVFMIVFFNCCNSFATNYYVNDDCATPNVFCDAGVVGANGNTGTSKSSPKRTLKQIFTAFSASFAAGDTIFIDAGSYANLGTDAATTESKFNVSAAGLVLMGAGVTKTIFNNNNIGVLADYFMQITANNTVVRDMTVKKYNGGASNSGTVYNRGTATFNTGGQAFSIFGCTGVLIENVNTFDNGNNGNAAISIGQNTTIVLKGGGSNCNATGSSYSGGIDIFGNNVNATILNYILAYNSKSSFNGSGLQVVGLTGSTFVYVKNTVISNNIGGAGGGAIYIDGGNVTLRECKILSNTTTGSAGPNRAGNGVAIVGGTVKIAKSVIQNNSSTTTTDFGGVGLTPSSSNIILSIDSCLFSGNGGTRANGKDLGARLDATKTFSITVNESTFGTYGANKAIDIGGGSTNSCTGNSFVITNSGNPSIIYSGGGTPNCALGAGSNTTASSFTANPIVPTFSGPCGSFAYLPVELLTFYATCENNSSQLTWTTASERNNDYFLIEKGDLNGDFKIVEKIKGSGNSSDSKHYNFSDLYAFSGISYYRLSQVDFNGKSELLSTVPFENNCLEREKSTCYYNPTLNEITINGEFNQSSDYSLKLINTLGQIISETTIKKSEKLTLKLDQEISKAVYFILIEGIEFKESIKVAL